MADFVPTGLGQIGASATDVVGFRHQAPGFDPISGEGARRFGGRFNPPGSYPVLYLCSTRACAVSELRRQAVRQVAGVEGLLPRELWIVTTRLWQVLDLTRPKNLEVLGVTGPDLVRDDHGFTQDLGRRAQKSGLQAIRTPSATGTDDVFAIFLPNLGSAELRVELIETWTSATDLENERPAIGRP